jgi:beta-N-acetylhexosaminidase
MAGNTRAAGMVMGGVGALSSAHTMGDAVELLSAYTSVGIKAFLFPGALLEEPEMLGSLASTARRMAFEAQLGPALVAIGGSTVPAFGLPPFHESPSPLGLAAIQSSAAARRAGFLLGSRLASCGVDMVLGPRLDLASDPKDLIGVLDGFGENSRLAGALGSAFIHGLFRAGVKSCVGRFPGLGSTCRDCYEGLAYIALPAARLERCEMRPFARAVAAHVPAIFVGRVFVPSLESDHVPASSSARLIEGRLRDALGFHGLVIGDDIELGEDPGKAAVLGALAGCDLCFFSRPDDALAAAAAFAKAASGGELPLIRIESARRRFQHLLAGREHEEVSGSVPKSIFRINSRGRKAKRDIEAAASLLRGSLPFDGAANEDFQSALVVVFTPPAAAPDYRWTGGALAAITEGLPGATVLALPADPGQHETDSLVQILSSRGRYSEAAILSYDAHFRPSQESLARLVGEYLPRFRLIAMRDPYDVAFFPNAVGLGAVFGFSEACAATAAMLLSGKLKPRGSCPVDVIGLEV